MMTIASFALFHCIFDEESGPELKEMLVHECFVSREIIGNVMTVLFTLSVGVGEPDGESSTSIVPLNVTNLSGTVLIYSFGIEDKSARGSSRLESLMLYVSKSLTQRLFQFTLEIKNIFDLGTPTLYSSELSSKEALVQIFENLRKVLLVDIDNRMQAEIVSLCEQKEKAVISDGIVRAFHNIILTPELINAVSHVHRSILPLVTPPMIEEAFENLPIEIHGINSLSRVFYFAGTKTCFNATFTSGKSRVGILARPFRNLVWKLMLEHNEEPINNHPPLEKPVVISPKEEVSNEYQLFSTFSPLLSDFSYFRVEKEEIICLATTNPERLRLQGIVSQLIVSLSALSCHMTSEELVQIVFEHDTRAKFLALLIPKGTEEAVETYVLVGESEKGIGLLQLIGETFREIYLNFRN
ncbi:MAG: hypothetical protein ACFFC7_21050 [Candidatus Hermodarchaeota archaeon]